LKQVLHSQPEREEEFFSGMAKSTQQSRNRALYYIKDNAVPCSYLAVSILPCHRRDSSAPSGWLGST